MLTIFAIALIALQIGDGITTIVALKREDLAEGNPAAASLMRRIGVARATILFKLLAVALVALVLLIPLFERVRLPAIIVATMFYAWVVIDNLRLALRQSRP